MAKKAGKTAIKAEMATMMNLDVLLLKLNEEKRECCRMLSILLPPSFMSPRRGHL